MPGDDLDRVLAGLKAGRVRFDDYRAIMDWGDGTNVKRAWRKGRMWRVETLIPGTRRWPAVPRDAGAAWWKEHEKEYMFVLHTVSDSENVYYYDAERNVFAPDVKELPRAKLQITQAITQSDDPFMPWPDMFFEHISPAESYVVIRSETSMFEPGPSPLKLAYVNTMVIEGLARSPRGFWYPTRVRRKTSNFNTEQVWRSHVFHHEGPDRRPSGATVGEPSR